MLYILNSKHLRNEFPEAETFRVKYEDSFIR